MTTKLSDLLAEFSGEEREDIERRSRLHLKAMAEARSLDEVRRAANRTQSELAQAMGIGQNAVSQLEKRVDIQLSTLHRYIKSMGLQLELSVVAPSGERVALKKFKPWADAKARVERKPSLEAKSAAASMSASLVESQPRPATRFT